MGPSNKGVELSLPPEALTDDDLVVIEELADLDVVRVLTAPPPPASNLLIGETPAEAFRPVKLSADNPAAWLERSNSLAGMQPAYGGGHMATVSPEEGVATSLAQKGGAWIGQVWRSESDREFANLASQIERAVRLLAERAELRALWSVARALYRAASDGGDKRAAQRAAKAGDILVIFGDPAMLTVVAAHVLSGRDTSEDARKILLQAGTAGAFGLYGARLKAVGQPGARAPFAVLMKEFGAKGWPVTKAALEKLHASMSNPGAREVAEDLLLCVSTSTVLPEDDGAGRLVSRFLHVDASPVNKAATAAIVKLWGDRARSPLFGLLDAKEDSVRLAAVAGLKQIGAIDERVVRRLEQILLRRVPAGGDLRVGAAMALAFVTAEARQLALLVLRQHISAKDTGAASLAKDDREDAVVVASAKALVHHGAPGARALIMERAQRSAEPLRSQLMQLGDRV